MKKSESTKQKIKIASLELFSTKGFRAVTVGDIAGAVGISRGCVYRYYENTSELFEDIVSGFFKDLEVEFSSALAGGATYTDCLNYIIDRFSKEILDKSASMVSAMMEYCRESGSRYMDTAFNGSVKVWSDFIRGGIASGEFKDVDPVAAAELVIISYLGARMCASAVDITADTAERTMGALRDYLLAGGNGRA